MYLAKFFHRAPGDDDRELLLIAGSDPLVMGIRMDHQGEPGSDQYLREEFAGIADAISAFRRLAQNLLRDGYVETDHTAYTLRTLLPEPRAKPDWQKGLDESMMLALGSSLAAQAAQFDALKATPARHEPFYLWLAAHHDYAAGDDAARTVRLAQQAADALRARRASRQPHYTWSIPEIDLEGRILELLSDAHFRADDPAAAVRTIEHLCRLAPTHERILKRAELICAYCPERREEAFDDAYQ